MSKLEEEIPPRARRTQPEASGNEPKLVLPAVHGWVWSIAARTIFVYSVHVLLWEPFHLNIRWELALPLFIRYYKEFLPGATFEWILAFYNLVFSLAIGMLWFLLDRRRRHEVAIQELARLIARYTLAGMLVQYGLEKLIASQGGWALNPTWLIRPLGEAGTGAAMMSWLSFSTVYEQFSGWVEAGAGLLIFSRRMTTLAAFLTVAAMLNVMIINASYFGGGTWTAPGIWLPQCMFLTAPYMGRFLNFFVLNRPTTMPIEFLERPLWLRRVSLSLKVIMIPLVLYGPLAENIAVARITAQRSPLAGNYLVESFERNGHTEPISIEFPARWREVAIDPLAEQIVTRAVDDSQLAMTTGWPTNQITPTTEPPSTSIELAKKTSSSEGELRIIWISATRRGTPIKNSIGNKSAVLHYKWVGLDQLALTGVIDGAAVETKLRKLPVSQMPFFLNRWKPI